MRTHSYSLARVKCSRFGVKLHVNYTGVLTPFSLRKLHHLISADPRPIHIGVGRIDQANTYEGWESAGHLSLAWTAPTALIVRLDQLSASLVYCANMAKQGILRQAFLASETEMAQVWAESAAALELSKRYRLERQQA